MLFRFAFFTSVASSKLTSKNSLIPGRFKFVWLSHSVHSEVIGYGNAVKARDFKRKLIIHTYCTHTHLQSCLKNVLSPAKIMTSNTVMFRPCRHTSGQTHVQNKHSSRYTKKNWRHGDEPTQETSPAVGLFLRDLTTKKSILLGYDYFAAGTNQFWLIVSSLCHMYGILFLPCLESFG